MAEKDVFSRQATGLVREMAPHHAFLYNMMAVGLTGFTEAVLFGYGPAVLPGGDVGIALLSVVLAAVPFYAVVSMLASSMPRAGGDYVWQSRILNPAVGFASALTAWTVWQWFFGAFLGSVIVTLGIHPLLSDLAALTGNGTYASVAASLGSSDATFAITTAILLLGLLIAVKGIKFYVKLQYVLFGGAALSLLTMLGLLISSSHQAFVSSFNAAMSASIGPNAYQTVMAAAASSGISISPQFSGAQTVTLWAVAWLSLGYAGWSIYNLGEIKRAGVLKLQFFQILGSFLAIGAIWALTWYVYSDTLGAAFIHAFNGLMFSANPGPLSGIISANPTNFFPYAASFPYLISLLTTNQLLLAIIFLGMAMGLFQVVLIIYFASTRIMLAASMDRILPKSLSAVSSGSGAPWVALLASFVGSEVWLYFVIYRLSSIGSYVASAGFGTEIAYILICVTAIVFPFRSRSVYESSPASRYRVGKMPLVSLLGALALAFNLFLTYEYVAGPNLFLTYPLAQSDEFVLGLFLACVLFYFAASWFRKRQGVDLRLSYKEMPPD